MLGEDLFRKTPYARRQVMPSIRPARMHATIYHFKWVRGIAPKIERRAKTESYTVGFYAPLLELLGGSKRKFHPVALQRYCNTKQLFYGPMDGSTPGAIRSRNLIDLFFNVKA